jgi:hypothetical protein
MPPAQGLLFVFQARLMKEGVSEEQREQIRADCSGFHALSRILPQGAMSSPLRV